MLPPWRLKVVVWAGTARPRRQTRPIPLCCWKTPKVRKGWSKRRRGEPVSPDGNRVRKIKRDRALNGHLGRERTTKQNTGRVLCVGSKSEVGENLLRKQFGVNRKIV